ncbi:MAG: sodium-dependent dicarboxylate transporter 2/3/5 [Arenicella sp.]
MPKNYPLQKQIGLFLGPALFILLLSIDTIEPLKPEAQKVLAVASWMLVWWMTEAVNISVTALLPMLLLPLLNIEGLGISEVTAPFSNKIIYLFMGGFVIAIAMEKWKLHLRIALNIVSLTGTNANGIILGFMLATAFLSMWISNTATTVMMLPIALSIIQILTERSEKETQLDSKKVKLFALSMMLAIAYAANIGGVATIIGTPPNTVFAGFMEKQGIQIDFLQWMLLGVPFSAVMLIITFLMLTKVLYPNKLGNFSGAEQLIKNEKIKLGKISNSERKVLIVFVCTALAWITRKYINGLFPTLNLSDTGIAMLGAITLFVIPTKFSEGKFILGWEDMKKLPWGILILFGGGLSLASAMANTGIIDLIGNYISERNTWETIWIILAVTATVLFMTELMSNVALITIFLPVIAGISVGLGENILWFAIPATIASSCAFMLPMATPPNAIVFASEKVKISEMAKAGFWLNLISVGMLLLFSLTLVKWVFG